MYYIVMFLERLPRVVKMSVALKLDIIALWKYFFLLPSTHWDLVMHMIMSLNMVRSCMVHHLDGLVQKDVTPLLTHWSYIFLALTHWSVWCQTITCSNAFSIEPSEANLSASTIKSKYENCFSRKFIRKCMQNFIHFIEASMYWIG